MKKVVAGICIKYIDNTPYVLLGLKPDGHWEFPGGKVESGESDENALHREWIEELDADIEVGDFYVNVENDPYNVHFYLVELTESDTIDGSKARAKEHIDVSWFGLDNLNSIPMAVGNDMVVDLLIEDYL
jgi:8-oxo-dGTP pyrophosphatase MutT (NUDIX family)